MDGWFALEEGQREKGQGGRDRGREAGTKARFFKTFLHHVELKLSTGPRPGTTSSTPKGSVSCPRQGGPPSVSHCLVPDSSTITLLLRKEFAFQS